MEVMAELPLLTTSTEPARQAVGLEPAPPRLLIGACGSVGVISLPHYLVAIRKRSPNIDIRVLLSRTAEGIIPSTTVELFCDAAVSSSALTWGGQHNHIELAEWADSFVILPATADILARTAHGFGDTSISLTALAYEGRITFFPNMNGAMWRNPSTKRNVEVLRASGHVVIEPLVEECYEVCTRQLATGSVLPRPKAVSSIIADSLRYSRHREQDTTSQPTKDFDHQVLCSEHNH
jgi:phosphopantothenoylcysteine synthetase/decarboxylase